MADRKQDGLNRGKVKFHGSVCGAALLKSSFFLSFLSFPFVPSVRFSSSLLSRRPSLNFRLRIRRPTSAATRVCARRKEVRPDEAGKRNEGATVGVVLKFLSSFRLSRLLLLPKALEESILTIRNT